MSKHIGVDRIQQYVDETLDAAGQAAVKDHLAMCRSCRSVYDDLCAIDAVLEEIPIERASAGFTQAVLNRLGLGAPSLAFRILERVAYAFGLCIVVGVMGAVFVLMGVFAGEGESGSPSDQVVSAVRAAQSWFAGAVTENAARFLPFLFGNETVALTAFMLAGLLLLAVLDRTVMRRAARRLR